MTVICFITRTKIHCCKFVLLVLLYKKFMEFLSKIILPRSDLAVEALSLVPFSECKSREFLHNHQIFCEVFFAQKLKDGENLSFTALVFSDLTHGKYFKVILLFSRRAKAKVRDRREMVKYFNGHFRIYAIEHRFSREEYPSETRRLV